MPAGRHRLLLIPAIAVVLMMLASACGWARYRGDVAHSGVNPFEHGIDRTNFGALQIAWTTPGRSFESEPVVLAGHVIVSGAVSVDAFDPATGREQWRRTDLLTQHLVSRIGQATTGAGKVYVTNDWADRPLEHGPYTFGATTYALDPATGATLAAYDGGTDLPPLATDDGWLYLGSRSAPHLDGYGPNGQRFSVATDAQVTDIVADADGVRAASGLSVQTIPPHGCGRLECDVIRTDVIPGDRSSPTVLAENAHSVFVVHEGVLDAFARSGCGSAVCGPAWTSDAYLGDGGALVVTDDSVFVATVAASPALRAFDARGCGQATCAPRWSSDFAPPYPSILTPMLANGLVVAGVPGDGADLVAWSAAGCGAPTCAPVASRTEGGADHPVVTDGAVYVLVGTAQGAALRKLTPPANQTRTAPMSVGIASR